ncbi:MAG TPA: hypothetical protein VND65_02150, partial [Candidatus Binatia bacterium]|nr:hypothetical protein [Candidatus Binatia bacterium]
MPLPVPRIARALAFISMAGIVCLAQSAGSGASAPINASPGEWSQLARFVAPGCCALLTNSVSISSDTAVVGMIPLNGNYNQVAKVFTKSAQGWRNAGPAATLSGTINVEPFTAPVAVDGDTIVTGGCTGTSENYVFVYVKPAGGWTDMATPTAVLAPSDGNIYFGDSVAISGDTIIVGDYGFNSQTGAAYVYVKPAGGWHNMTETAQLSASDGQANDLFGYSVSISGNTAVVGATQFGAIGTAGPGKAYVFVEPNGGWKNMTQTAELTVSDGADFDETGLSVSIDGDTILVGSPIHNRPLGAAFIYEKPSSGWTNMTESATLTPGDGLTGGNFASSVAISGSIAVAGTPYRGYTPFGGE